MVVKVIDNGYTNYKEAFKALHNKSVNIGLFAKVGNDVLTKGIVNEFGTKNIPERSFLRKTFNDEYKKVAKQFDKIIISFGKKDLGVDRKLRLIGRSQQGAVQKTITDLKVPPNAASTIKAKGSSNPLIDTGEMRLKINYEIRWVVLEDRY